MSLTASMWTGVSGLLAHGDKMNVIGNNIANVNTVGFKGQRMDFADFIYQNTFTVSGIGQVGRGVSVGAIMNDFSQGPYETTTDATDLAIGGRGFFQVKKIGTKESYYTRAGNFRFDKQGYLTDPNGLALQGWKIDNSGGVQQAAGGLSNALNTVKSNVLGSGVPEDIQLDSWTVKPQQTTNVQFQVNLSATEGKDSARNSSNPFAGLFEMWNGEYPPAIPNAKPIPGNGFSHQATIGVYDEAGVEHKLTVYYDKVNSDDYSGGEGDLWEYIVTMDPSEDERMFVSGTDAAGQPILSKVNSTSAGGLLMSGTMSFNKAGNMTNQTAYTWGGTQNADANGGSFTDVVDPSDPAGLKTLKVINLDPNDSNNWYPATISNSGLPLFVANFSGVLDAQTTGSPSGNKYNTELDFGVKISNYTMPWQSTNSLGSLTTQPYSYNTNYNPNDPTKGPEYYLLNTEYNSALDKSTNAKGYNYLFNSVPMYSRDANGAITGPDGAAITINGATVSSVDDLKKALDTLDAAGTGTIVYNGATLAAGAGAATKTAMDAAAAANGNWPPFSQLTNAQKNAYWLDANAVVTNAPKDPVTNLPIIPGTMFGAAVPADANKLANMTKPAIVEANASTSYSGASSTYGSSQDGYTYGDLTGYSVDAQGILSGTYSNGISLPLWQVVLYDFTCTQGLRREGGNLYSRTRESGEPKSGPAGVAGLGKIQGNTLEQSNVDMSREFVQMITTQRGFQSNSKIITTTDTMLDTVINMKR